MDRHRRLSRLKKKVKRRLVLVSMTVVAGVYGVLYVVHDKTTHYIARDPRGNDDGIRVHNDHRLLHNLEGRWTSVLTGEREGEGGEGGEGGSIKGEAVIAHHREVATGMEVEVMNAERILSSAGTCEVGAHSAGMTILYVLGIVYCFLGLAIVCDEFFQQSLEIISDVLKLTPDVAGATFLAAGSSAPELFTSLTDAFGAANSTGTGTIVGSAMFNILVIVALSAAVAGRDGNSILIDWRPVSRDVAFYSYSILILTLVFLDSEVQWWEGFIMVISYGFYIIFMKYNAFILGYCQSSKIGITDELPSGDINVEAVAGAAAKAVTSAVKAVTTAAKRTSLGGGDGGEDIAKVSPSPQDDSTKVIGPEEEEAGAIGKDGKPVSPAKCRSETLGVRNRAERRISGGMFVGDALTEGTVLQQGKAEISNAIAAVTQRQAVADEEVGSAAVTAAAAVATGIDSAAGGPGTAAGKRKASGQGEEEELEEESRFVWPSTLPDQVLFVLGLPLLTIFTFTIPDCSKPKWRQFYVVSFVMSLWWIGFLTHYMVEWATAVGCDLDVSPIFMGLVVLAIGTSVPDALGSMIAAKSGEANMAIANAVGSNVFDILVGLGVPWFLRGLILQEAMPVDRDGIALNVVILFCTGLLFVATLALNKWVMRTRTGIFLFSLYILYVIFVIIQELL